MKSKSGEFFTSAKPSRNNSNCQIQIISERDIKETHGMPAGENEDQFKRLSNMTNKLQHIKEEHSQLPIITTDKVVLPKYWQKLFVAMDHGNETETLELLAKIPEADTILQALLTTHPMSYLRTLISFSIASKAMGMVALPTEITITPGTFEILIKDLATTLLHPAKVQFSFGLPTHHAFRDSGSGFCIMDKTAMLIKYKAQTSLSSLKFIIVGTDINRDNGLSHDLMTTASKLDICHVDIFDSRVYPGENHLSLELKFKSKGQDVGQEIRVWTQNNMAYFAVDLSLTQRGNGSMHAALEFALEKIRQQMKQAQDKGQRIMLMLPTGWDSHQDETAPCGKYINDHWMNKDEAERTRFSNQDLSNFYEQLFDLYKANQKVFSGVYWGLEGGYNRSMYERQIELLMNIVLEKLVNHPAQEPSKRL
ncbi:MAG: acetylpolyamine aminohydrolase [Legionella sp.]|uniref:acetylpolyamine aminohydrolase n=1 Tax=Legionella sp. TaxID=459 RepID=UPI0039E4CDAC